jgi:hypothetical protein
LLLVTAALPESAARRNLARPATVNGPAFLQARRDGDEFPNEGEQSHERDGANCHDSI